MSVTRSVMRVLGVFRKSYALNLDIEPKTHEKKVWEKPYRSIKNTYGRIPS
jgi:hypothetical protein